MRCSTQGLFHVAIKTGDLDATIKFYSEILGLELAPRPDFGFPGAWMAVRVKSCRSSTSTPAVRRATLRPARTARAVDHVSLTVSGWDECLARVKKRATTGAPGDRAEHQPLADFVFDPSGVMVDHLRRQQGKSANARPAGGARLHVGQAVR